MLGRRLVEDLQQRPGPAVHPRLGRGVQLELAGRVLLLDHPPDTRSLLDRELGVDPPARQSPLDDGGEQSRLPRRRPVDRLDGHPGLGSDPRDGGAGVAAREEHPVRSLQDAFPGARRLLSSRGCVIAAAGPCVLRH